jgi:exodeoxyribonuclease-3
MTIVTWNVNSVRARLDRVLAWLAKHEPDVLCLQELKTSLANLPVDAFKDAGYHVAAACQPTWNGVAILSREEPCDVLMGMNDGEDDAQARLVAATVGGIRIVSVYVPNGQVPESDKYQYKLRWLDRLRTWLEHAPDPAVLMAVCGDFNIVPRDIDAHDPAIWTGSVLLNPEVRERLGALLDLGLVDVTARHHPEGGPFSWWDYRMMAFPRNHGLRIDLILASQALADRCVQAWVDRDERKGEKPSDHAPVLARFGS